MIVVDNSVVVDLIVDPESSFPLDPLQDWWAPTILDAEYVNVLRRLIRARHLTLEAAHACLEDFTALSISRWQLDALTRERMLELGQRLTAYDAAYVVVAEALDAPLFTRDASLARAAGDLVECHVV